MLKLVIVLYLLNIILCTALKNNALNKKQEQKISGMICQI